mmetsp:Transcript_11422/g.18966  ORF Transcript_11422/g.18966 Transcript_11422/m.18966 type:complete len:201 (+) Transcript_11422:410-1012(+)
MHLVTSIYTVVCDMINTFLDSLVMINCKRPFVHLGNHLNESFVNCINLMAEDRVDIQPARIHKIGDHILDPKRFRQIKFEYGLHDSILSTTTTNHTGVCLANASTGSVNGNTRCCGTVVDSEPSNGGQFRRHVWTNLSNEIPTRLLYTNRSLIVVRLVLMRPFEWTRSVGCTVQSSADVQRTIQLGSLKVAVHDAHEIHE